jgi:hypothetical protein
MPVWLSPRRLGMMAAVIAVIVCTLLLTRRGDDSTLEPNDVSPHAPIERIAATPPATRMSPLTQPSLLIDALAPPLLEVPSYGSFDETDGTTSLTSALEDVPSHPLSQPTLVWPHELFASNIVGGLSGCGDCTWLHSPGAGLHSVGFPGAGGRRGAASGTGSGLGTAGSEDTRETLDAQAVQTLVEVSSPSEDGNRGSSSFDSKDPAPPWGDSNSTELPDLVSHGPGSREAVSVPEPSTMVLLGAGAAAAMTGWRSRRKRRG